ncbi:B12-binding domain-containing radical SAM protein [Chloroflexota bacterium]
MKRKNRITLVYPDYRSGIFSTADLPVGLGYVAEALELAGIEYEVVDLNIDSVDGLFSKVNEFRPQFLGVSMMSYRCKETYELLHDLKHKFPEVRTVVGGPHVTANQERVLTECPTIDIGVVGEGEVAIIEIVGGSPLSTIKGVLYREGSEVSFTGTREFISNLDEITFPTYHGFKLESYGKTMPVNSSRGCPYKCIFCGAPRILGNKWRKRSAQSMLTEVKYWYEKGYRSFYFSDSNFAVDKTRVRDFCEAIIKSKLDASFTSDGLRADHVDPELLKQMRRAGFTQIVFGVESGSNKVLKNLKKGETREQIESTIATATDLEFHVTLFFLIGSPGEDAEDIKQSFQLAQKYDVDEVYFFNLTPIPQTEFYDWAVKQGFLDECGVRYPEGNFGFSKRAILRTDVMTIDQITRWIKKARHIERQIQWRYELRKLLQRGTKKKAHTNNWLFNTLTWYISYPVLTGLFGYLFRLTIKSGVFTVHVARKFKIP